MLSAVITALLFCVMLLIVATLIFSAFRERKRHLHDLAVQAHAITHPLDPQVTGVLQLQADNTGNIEKSSLLFSAFTLPSSWYTHRRTLVSLGLLLMIFLTLFVQSGLTDGAIQDLGKSLSFFTFSQPTDGYSQPIDSHTTSSSVATNLTASQRLVRVDSADRSQYYTDYQWQVWSYSSCSGIAMEMVMNAYGRHLIAADVLQVELNLGVWSVYGGLLNDDGIALTASNFGFNTSASHSMSLQALIGVANRGTPVIVSVRDNYYFPGGHIFVVRGGNSQFVYIADSSPANFQRMTHAQFLAMWQGFSAILTPR